MCGHAKLEIIISPFMSVAVSITLVREEFLLLHFQGPYLDIKIAYSNIPGDEP